MFDKLKMIQQAREMQKKMSGMIFDYNLKGIQIQINGKQEILKLEIDPEKLSDKETLEKDLTEVFNEAVKKSQNAMAMSMQGDLSQFM